MEFSERMRSRLCASSTGGLEGTRALLDLVQVVESTEVERVLDGVGVGVGGSKGGAVTITKVPNARLYKPPSGSAGQGGGTGTPGAVTPRGSASGLGSSGARPVSARKALTPEKEEYFIKLSTPKQKGGDDDRRTSDDRKQTFKPVLAAKARTEAIVKSGGRSKDPAVRFMELSKLPEESEHVRSLREQRALAELEGCTFKPEVVTKRHNREERYAGVEKVWDWGTFFRRTENNEAARAKWLAEEQERKEASETQGCTFAPEISQRRVAQVKIKSPIEAKRQADRSTGEKAADEATPEAEPAAEAESAEGTSADGGAGGGEAKGDENGAASGAWRGRRGGSSSDGENEGNRDGAGSPLSKALHHAGATSHVKRQEKARRERAWKEKAVFGRGLKPWTGEVTVPVAPQFSSDRRRTSPAATSEPPASPWTPFPRWMRSPWATATSTADTPSPSTLIASPPAPREGADQQSPGSAYFTPSPGHTATPQSFAKSTAQDRKHDHELQMSVQKNAIDLLADF